MVSNAAMTHSASLPPFRVALQSAGIGHERSVVLPFETGHLLYDMGEHALLFISSK